MGKNRILLIFFLLIFLFGCIEETDFFSCKGTREVFVSRVIDGDTIEAEEKKIRLVGINTPEKKEKCFEEAKEFLEELVLGKKIGLKGKEKDRYGRILGSICVNEKSVNKKLLEEGFAHYYSPEDFPELEELQENAMQEKKGCLWREGTEKYIQEKCIKLEKLEFNQDSLTGEYAEFSNDCDYSIDLNGFYLKDEATNLYFFPAVKLKGKSFVRVFSADGEDSINEFYWKKGNVWNNTGDQMFLRNSKGILVVYYSYDNI